MSAHQYVLKSSKIPPLYSQENAGGGAIAHIKLYEPWGARTWYLTEYDAEDRLAFGFVAGTQFPEMGYTSLAEMAELRGPFGLRIERDIHWDPTALRDIPEYAKHTEAIPA